MFHAKHLIISSVLFAISTAVFAKNEWTNPYGNLAHTSFLAQQTNPAKFRVLWSKETSEFISRPVISDNIYYIGVSDSGAYELVAIDIKSGNTLWNKQEKQNFTMDYAVTYNNSVFVTSAHGVSSTNDADYHILEAYDAKSGRLKYSMRLSNKNPTAVKPMVFADSVYVQGSILESINAATGTYNWMMNIPTEETYANTLSMNDKNIYSQSEQMINVYNRSTGQQEYSLGALDAHAMLVDAPSIIDQKNNAIYYFDIDKNNQSELHAYDLKSHNSIWSTPFLTKDFVVQMTLANGEIYAARKKSQQKNDNQPMPDDLVNLDSKTGAVKWSWSDESYTLPISIAATSDTIFISSDAYTYAISMKTHQTVWKIAKTGTLSLGKNTLLITSENDLTAVALN